MVKLIRGRRPPFRLSGTRRDKALQDSQFDLLMEIIQPGHPENPFKARDIAVRNALIVHLLICLGIRRGELLGIRIPDIEISELTLTIHRRPDEPVDPRLRQPYTKTLARTLPLSPRLAEIILDYTVGVRKYIREAKRTRLPYRGAHAGSAPRQAAFHPRSRQDICGPQAGQARTIRATPSCTAAHAQLEIVAGS